MRVAGVRIRGYRGIDDIVLPLAPLTVLVGSNGAGKSSILEALGYITHEDGALRRRDDPRPKIDWYLAPPEHHALSSRLASTSDADSDVVLNAIKPLQKALVVHRHHGGHAELALNLFELVIDKSPRRQLATSRTILSALDPLATRHQWATMLQHQVALAAAAPQEAPRFVDLGVPVPWTVETPSAVSMLASPDDISPVLLRCVSEVGRTVFAPLLDSDHTMGAAFDALAMGQLAPLRDVGVLNPVLRLIEEATVEVLPGFIRAVGEPRLEWIRGSDTDVGEALGLLNGLHPHVGRAGRSTLEEIRRLLLTANDTSDIHLDSVFVEAPDGAATGYRYSRLGTGYRRWVCGAIDEASRRLVRRFTLHPFSTEEAARALTAKRIEGGTSRQPAAAPMSIRLIDEPVESLEPLVHSQVLKWLRERLSDRETMILSTHHASILSTTDAEHTEVIGVYRRDGAVQVVPIGPNLLEGLRKHLGDIKLSREELLFSTRALLLVEGPNDSAILQALYGDELAERGVLVHPIGGSDHVVIEAAFRDTAYGLLALPTWVMLDNHVHDAESPAVTAAAAALAGQDLRLLPFEGIDIAFAISPTAYRATANRHDLKVSALLRQTDDDKVYAAWSEHANAVKAKRWLLHEMGLDPRHGSFSSQLVPKLMETISTADNVGMYRSRWLTATMDLFFDDFTKLEHRRAFEPAPPG